MITPYIILRCCHNGLVSGALSGFSVISEFDEIRVAIYDNPSSSPFLSIRLVLFWVISLSWNVLVMKNDI